MQGNRGWGSLRSDGVGEWSWQCTLALCLLALLPASLRERLGLGTARRPVYVLHVVWGSVPLGSSTAGIPEDRATYVPGTATAVLATARRSAGAPDAGDNAWWELSPAVCTAALVSLASPGGHVSVGSRGVSGGQLLCCGGWSPGALETTG